MQTAGALVAEPQSGSPAEKAGVKAGDVIVSLDGRAVKDSREVAQKIGTMSPGSSVKLGIIRGGSEETINVTLAQMPDQKEARADQGQEDHTQSGRLGLTLAPASATGAGDRGVVVTAVDPNGPAAEHGIKTGDVITNVGGSAVSTPADVQKQLAELRKAGKHAVLMQVKSDQGTHYVAVPLAVS
jgi:serine protease Do